MSVCDEVKKCTYDENPQIKVGAIPQEIPPESRIMQWQLASKSCINLFETQMHFNKLDSCALAVTVTSGLYGHFTQV